MSLNDYQKIRIACVGMTHLGLIYASAFAEKGFNLIAYEDNVQFVADRSMPLPVNEPQLSELIERNVTGLQFTSDLKQLRTCDLVFITCDVPTDDEGNSNLQVIDALIAKIAPMLSEKACLIILSQVPPGYTRGIQFDKSRLYYQVETLIFGRAVERALYPERYIIGAYNPNAALPDTYLSLLSSFDCPILKMRYESAELAKISINMFLVSSVTTTNTIAEICEHIGADWEEIAPALRLDKRIGQHAYLTPGLGIAGGNLERDLNTIIKLGRAKATDVGVVNSWLKNSKYRRDWVLRCLKEQVLRHIQDPLICVLGLSYKPDTHSIKNSPSIALLEQLKNHRIKAHDPVVIGVDLAHVKQEAESLHAVKAADVVIIMTPWADYKNLSFELLKKHMQGNTIIDPFRVLMGADASARTHFNYFSLGV
jgi:UDPglucose 6-dehydrogenase